MSYTYETLIADIYAWTTEDADTELGENIDSVISLAYRRVQRDLDLDIFIATYSGNLANGRNDIARPADMIEISEIYYISSNAYVPLLKRSLAYIRDYWPTPFFKATVKYWAENGLTDIIVAPTHTSSLSYFIRYLARITPLSSALPAGSDWISRNMADMLLFACLEESEAFLHEEKRGRVELWQSKYAGALPKAKQETAGMTRVTGERARRSDDVKPAAEDS